MTIGIYKGITGTVLFLAFEREIDEMVYKLYGLTDDEIKIVEGKGKC